MIKFLMNLFKIGKKKQKKGVQTFIEDNMVVELDVEKGSMLITTDKELSKEQIIKLFRKYTEGK